MLKVVYGKKGAPVSDNEVLNWVDYNLDNYISSLDKVVYTCNEIVLLAFALRVLEGKVGVEDIEFYLEDEKLEFDPVLGIQNPKGKTIGIYSEIVEKSLQVSHKKIRELKMKKCVD